MIKPEIESKLLPLAEEMVACPGVSAYNWFHDDCMIQGHGCHVCKGTGQVPKYLRLRRDCYFSAMGRGYVGCTNPAQCRCQSRGWVLASEAECMVALMKLLQLHLTQEDFVSVMRDVYDSEVGQQLEALANAVGKRRHGGNY